MNSNRYGRALKAYEAWRLARQQLRTHRIIANSSIPKHKQELHDHLVTRCNINEFNTRSAFNSASSRLIGEDKDKLARKMAHDRGFQQ